VDGSLLHYTSGWSDRVLLVTNPLDREQACITSVPVDEILTDQGLSISYLSLGRLRYARAGAYCTRHAILITSGT
jgi:hypothetical protein